MGLRRAGRRLWQVCLAGAVLLALVFLGTLAVNVAATAFDALDPDVPRSRAETHRLAPLAEGDVLAIAYAHARPRERMAERGFAAPRCLPAGYGVPRGDILVLHLRPDGTCDAIRLRGYWEVRGQRFGLGYYRPENVERLGGVIVRGAGRVWRWEGR